MNDRPYSPREIDTLFQEVYRQIAELKSRPFEKDVRESLSRLEINLSNVQQKIEERFKEERAISNKSYTPYYVGAAIIAFFGIIGVTIATRFANFFIPPLP